MIPGDEYRQHRRFGSQSEFGQHKSSRSGHAKKINKDSLSIQGIEINQKPERAVALKNLQHLARSRSLINSAIAQAYAPLVNQRFNLWIIDPAHQKAQRIPKQREGKTRKLPGPDVTRE